jgi:hypothetical protein
MARLEASEGECENYLSLLSQNIKWRKHSETITYIDDNISNIVQGTKLNSSGIGTDAN